ncbi:hypothetical protein EBR16_04720, partial [bacterium]|nr:hypothetical protein [bacterium]
ASEISAIGAIAAESGFNKTGAGVLTINEPLSFTGGINVAEGTLVLANGGTLGGGTVTFDTGTTFRLSKNDAIVTNQVGGNGALLVDVTGAVLSGNVSFDTVTVAAGASLAASASLAATTATTLGLGAVLDGAGATAFTLGETTLSGEVRNAPDTSVKGLTLDSAGALRLRAGKDLSVAGALSNVAGTIVADALVVTGSVTSTGSLLLTGPLSGSVINLNGGNVTAASINSVGSFTNAASATITGGIIASGVVNAGGVLTAASLTNSGKLTVQGGLFSIAGNGSVTASEYVISGGTLRGPISIPSTKTLTLSGGGTLDINTTTTATIATVVKGVGNLTMSGPGLATVSGAYQLPAVAVTGNQLNISGVISNTSGLGLTKTGTGLLVLTGTNTFGKLATSAINAGNNAGDLQLNLASTTGLMAGMLVSGTGIAPGTRIDTVLSGQVSLTQPLLSQPSGTATFSNGLDILGGTVRVGVTGHLGLAGTPVVVAAGGALDLANDTTNAAYGRTLYVAGSGPAGGGALVNNGATALINTWTNVQLTGDAAVGGSQRVDLVRSATTATLNLNGYTLTKVGNNYSAIVSAQVSEGAIVVNGGTLSLTFGSLANPGGAVFPAGVVPANSLTVNNGATLELYGAPTIPAAWKYNLNDGSTLNVTNAAATIASNATVTGTARLLANNSITLNGAIDGAGKLWLDGSTGATYTTTLNGASAYAGGTLLGGGNATYQNIVVANANTALGTGAVTLVSGTSPSLRINGGVSLANNFTIGTNAGAMIGLVGTGLIMQTGTGVAEITGNITVNNGTTAGGMFYGGSSLANALKLSG